jgi:hypothetical protein
VVQRFLELFAGALGGVGSLFGLAFYVWLSSAMLKYLQHVLGLHAFQPDWLNYLFATFVPPVLVFGLIAFIFNGLGHLLFGTPM